MADGERARACRPGRHQTTLPPRRYCLGPGPDRRARRCWLSCAAFRSIMNATRKSRTGLAPAEVASGRSRRPPAKRRKAESASASEREAPQTRCRSARRSGVRRSISSTSVRATLGEPAPARQVASLPKPSSAAGSSVLPRRFWRRSSIRERLSPSMVYCSCASHTKYPAASTATACKLDMRRRNAMHRPWLKPIDGAGHRSQRLLLSDSASTAGEAGSSVRLRAHGG